MAVVRIILMTVALALMAVNSPAWAALDDKPAPAELPDFRDLKVDWWRYLDEADKSQELNERVEQVIRKANEFANDLPLTSRDLSQPIIQRFEATLRAYAAISQNPKPASVGALPALSETYRIDSLLALSREMNNLDTVIDLKQSAFSANERRQRKDEYNYNRQLAEYLQLDQTKRADPVRTLSLVAEKAAIKLNELRAQRQKAMLDLRRQRAELLQGFE